MQTTLQERSFSARLSESEVWTDMMMLFLKARKHLTSFRKASKDEDIQQAIDYWVDYGDGREVPIQFKLRIVPGNTDFPIVRYQPFWGVECAETVVGRDFRGLVEGTTERYYVAVKNQRDQFCEIYFASKEKLKPILLKMDADWEVHDKTRPWHVCKSRATQPKNSYWLASQCNERAKGLMMLYSSDFEDDVKWEIWWQKNGSERFPKINFYLPSSLKEGSFEIPDAVATRMTTTARQARA